MLARAQPVHNLPRVHMRGRQQFHGVDRVVVQRVGVVGVYLGHDAPLPRAQFGALPLRIAERRHLAVRMPQIAGRIELRYSAAAYDCQPYFVHRAPPVRECECVQSVIG